MGFDYFYEEEAAQFSFYKILFTDFFLVFFILLRLLIDAKFQLLPISNTQ